MTIQEKIKLVNLLLLYQQEMLRQIDTAIENKDSGNYYDYMDLIHGRKAQYNHARIIAQRISADINKEIPV